MNTQSQDLLGENLDTDAGKAASILGDPSKRLSHILGCGLVDIQLIHFEDDRPIVTPSTVVMSIRTIIDRIGLLTIRQYSLSDLNAFAFNVGAAVTTAFYKTKAEVALRIQDHLLLASTSYLDLRDARSVSV